MGQSSEIQIPVIDIATDGTFPAANNAKLPNQSATKTYVDNATAVTRFINTDTGLDTNPGTLALPWKTANPFSKIRSGTLTIDGASALLSLGFSNQKVEVLVASTFTGNISGAITVLNSDIRLTNAPLTAQRLSIVDQSSFNITATSALTLRPAGVPLVTAVSVLRGSTFLSTSTLTVLGACTEYIQISDNSVATLFSGISVSNDGVTPSSCATKIVLKGDSKLVLKGSALVASGVTPSVRDVDLSDSSKVIRATPTPNALAVEYPIHNAADAAAFSGWGDRPISSALSFTVKQSAAVSAVLYEDKHIILSWNTTDRQVQYNLKNTGVWATVFIYNDIILGSAIPTNANSTVRATSGQAPLLTNTARHFSRAGTIDTNYNLNQVGTVGKYAVWSASSVTTTPYYKVEAYISSTFSNFLITVGNPF